MTRAIAIATGKPYQEVYDARNTRFGSHWTEAQPEPQHSGTILWIFVALVLACIVGATLLRLL